MISNFIILILVHFISDWFFQPEKWAINKIKFVKIKFFHCVQYAVLFIPALYFLKINLLWTFWIFLSHFLTDDKKFLIWWGKRIQGNKNLREWIVIVQDQVLHILFLIPLVL